MHLSRHPGATQGGACVIVLPVCLIRYVVERFIIGAIISRTDRFHFGDVVESVIAAACCAACVAGDVCQEVTNTRGTGAGLGVIKHWYQLLSQALKEEQSLVQVIAAKRVACTSDDPETLLITMTNLLTIDDIPSLQQLWKDEDFRNRLLELSLTAYDRTLEWQGRDKIQLARESAMFYRICLAHILLLVRKNYYEELEPRFLQICRSGNDTENISWLRAPVSGAESSSPVLIDASLAWSIIHSSVTPASRAMVVHMISDYSGALLQPRWRLLSLVVHGIGIIDTNPNGASRSVLEQVQAAYYRNPVSTLKAMWQALDKLWSASIFGLDPSRYARLLAGILECATKLVVGDRSIDLAEKFNLFQAMEIYLREAGKATERLIPLWHSSRIELVKEFTALAREYPPSDDHRGATRILQLLEKVRLVAVNDYTYTEDRMLLDSLDPLIRQLEEIFPSSRAIYVPGYPEPIVQQIRRVFDNFNSDIEKVSKRIPQRATSHGPDQEAAQPSIPEDPNPQPELDQVVTSPTTS
ncbi:hypothetical protein M407DRAFT_10344 [Tulasnella calospora MUT 4182]|uniref:Uncharacterized protein n=1 Tax=Tulasnella calospora MUT 4182 TaxID=1051891 RepID=A0A0C3Q0L6_9AGAM|nr:hypothetical protein M407DRAFT_10344 [Tulasnella calospora MUT 4182]